MNYPRAKSDTYDLLYGHSVVNDIQPSIVSSDTKSTTINSSCERGVQAPLLMLSVIQYYDDKANPCRAESALLQ